MDLISWFDEYKKKNDELFKWVRKEMVYAESEQPDLDAIHLQKEQAYMKGWEDARKAMIHTITGQPPEPHYPSWYAEQIKEVPSVQQKTGMWIALDECANEGIYCSICRKKVFKYDFSNTMKKWKSFKYCPNCGAKMEVEQDD